MRREKDRPAADLAVLDIFLRPGGRINDNLDPLAAIRTANLFRVAECHYFYFTLLAINNLEAVAQHAVYFFVDLTIFCRIPQTYLPGDVRYGIVFHIS